MRPGVVAFARKQRGVVEWSWIGLVAVVCFFARTAPARQVSPSPSLSNVRRAFEIPAAADLTKPAAPRYDVIALRVAFQPDTSRYTTGDGTFNGVLFETLSPEVDPLPHDLGYFDAHLQYLENYVARVSNGRTTVESYVIPEVIQVSRTMGEYSPTGPESDSDAELVKLARLVEEAWTLAGRQSSFDMSGFDPATTALLIFHAGVGRDIELVGTTLDKTPEDLPTIFFDGPSLARLLERDVSFKGFPVGHTLLLPRTETRQGFDFIQDQPFLVEFSINGLLAASFFNFLGVPDLFDTESGESAIGPFGLMDPLGLFAYNGLFSPEPSAWTRQYLGWTEPVEIEGAGPVTVSLDAASSSSGSSEVARVSISASEYFLVENRHRDLASDGLKLTIYRDGQLVEQHFENGQEDFNSISINGFEGGVVVDADDYDWALPGGRDEDGNDLTGGILVWHIDENVIRQEMSANRVNADPDRRGVDLEEADSAQDIGFPSGNVFAPQSHLGSPFDFFYEDNPVLVITSTGEEIRLYQNRFGPDTYPNSHTNAGGPSFITLDSFSAPGPSMTFVARRGTEAGIAPANDYPEGPETVVPDGSYLSPFMDDDFVFQSAAGEARVVRQGSPSIREARASRLASPVSLPDGRAVLLALDGEPAMPALVFVDGSQSIKAPLSLGGELSLEGRHSHLLFDAASGSLFALFRGSSTSEVFEIDPSSLESLSRTIPGASVFSIASTDEGNVGMLGTAGMYWTTGERAWDFTLNDDADVGQLVLGVDESGFIGAFPVISEDRLVFLESDRTVVSIDVNRYLESDAALSRYPVLLDIDGDGVLEVLASYGPYLLAFYAGGGLVDGFPIEMPAASVTQPLIVSFEGRQDWTIIVGAEDGYMYAFQSGNRGRQAPGFPLALGSRIAASPVLMGNRLIGVDGDGAVGAWEIEGIETVWWSQQHADRYNTSFVRATREEERPASHALLVAGENYNWPNPIREGETFFRLTPTQDVRATITIIDAAGRLIDELVIENVRGNTATDVPWQTNAASGLYYARIKAATAAGDNETRMIKLAIIR